MNSIQDPFYHRHAANNCHGKLEFHHIDKKTVTKYGKKITYENDYYQCQSCGAIIKCILFRSYDEMVLNHDFPKEVYDVPFVEYRRIMKKYGLWEER